MLKKRKAIRQQYYRTAQNDVWLLQSLSLVFANCGAGAYNFFNGPTKELMSPGLAIGDGIINVELQTVNALVLLQFWDKFIADPLKKNDNYVAKTIRKLPKPIKTLSRLFIEWKLWRIEKDFLHKFFS